MTGARLPAADRLCSSLCPDQLCSDQLPLAPAATARQPLRWFWTAVRAGEQPGLLPTACKLAACSAGLLPWRPTLISTNMP